MIEVLRKWSLDLRGGGYPTPFTPSTKSFAPPAGLEPATLRVAAPYINQGPDSAIGDLSGHVSESNVRHGAPAGARGGSNSCVSVPLIMALTTGCDACDNGCTCQGGSPGCEHFACWGVGATNSCPHAESHLARLHAGLAGRP